MVEEAIERKSERGFRGNVGVAFVSFHYEDCVMESIYNFELLRDIGLDKEYTRLLDLSAWDLDTAPPPSDLQWENLGVIDRSQVILHRCGLNIAFFLFSVLIISILVVSPRDSSSSHS